VKRLKRIVQKTVTASFWAKTLTFVSLAALVMAQVGYAHQERTNAPVRYQAIDKTRPKNGDRFEAPTLSGPEQTYDSVRFRVHYTRFGKDAVSSLDRNADGVLDYVEQVADVLEQVYQVEVSQLGWVAPPSDGGFGGNALYDVYLSELLSDGVAGFTDGGFGGAVVGDNPNSFDVVETAASFSLMGLDNDFVDPEGFGENTTPETLLRTTVAHEYAHALEMGYDADEPLDWIWEASATWMQDEVFNDVNDANSLIADVLDAPSTCQAAADPYGMWIFLRFISERFGATTVRAIWENAVMLDGYATIEAALRSAGSTLDEVIEDFPVAVLTRDFREGANYPTVRLEATVAGNRFSPDTGVEQGGYDFLALSRRGTTTVRLEGSGLKGRLVGLANGQAQVFDLQKGQATIQVDAFDQVYLVVINPQRQAVPDVCTPSAYAVVLEDAVGPLSAPVQRENVANFDVPQVGELAPDNDGETPRPIDVPPDLIPKNLPAGFEVVDAFEETLEGETFAVVTFENGVGDFIEVRSTDTPFATLDAWLASVQLDPVNAHRVMIKGIGVLLEDLSEAGDPFFLATFIKGGRRVEVSSNLNGVLPDVVAGLLD